MSWNICQGVSVWRTVALSVFAKYDVNVQLSSLDFVHRRSFCEEWMSTLYVHAFIGIKLFLTFIKFFLILYIYMTVHTCMFPGSCVICMFIFLCFSFLFFIFVCWENSITHIVITNGEMHFQFNSNSFIDHFTWQCVMKRSNF